MLPELVVCFVTDVLVQSVHGVVRFDAFTSGVDTLWTPQVTVTGTTHRSASTKLVYTKH